MVTNLKRSRKIRAFCYRMIAAAALITVIITAIVGREALVSFYYQGYGAYSTDICDRPEFKEFIAEIYNKALVGYAGIGDDMGYPLTDDYADMYAEQAVEEFEAMLEQVGDDIIYYIQMPNNHRMYEDMDMLGTSTNLISIYSNYSYPLFSEHDGHLLLPEDTKLCCYWDGPNGMVEFFGSKYDASGTYDPAATYYDAQYKPNRETAAEIKLVLAVKEDCSSDKLSNMIWRAEKYAYVLTVFAVSVAVWVIFGILSLISGKAAKQAKEDFAKVSGKVWLEIKLILIAILVLLVINSNLHYLLSNWNMRMRLCNSLWAYFPLGCVLYLFYIDIRQNGLKVLARSLPVKCFGSMKGFVQSKPWYRRAKVIPVSMLAAGIVMVINGAYLLYIRNTYYPSISFMRVKPILSILGIASLMVGILLLVCYVIQEKLLKDTASIVDKLKEMKEGRGNVPLQISKNSLLASAADDLNELENGIERAVEEQNRSNRMKVELITNVSHDLKTPLTSIINYADLLCEEELSETAAGYATALQGKAYRLKNMVQDVFDLSKATSGNLNVENAVIDLVKLIRQTLADMDERIQESNLSFRLNIATEPLMIEADGEKLYRVFQNLFVNALQYSLENSRVHVQLAEENGFAVARVKNTSRRELDFDTEEIVERFVRADSSRTSEGSGLGLSIVQSFVEACGGQFRIETDADMFTACVRFPLVKQEEPEE